MKQVFCVGTDDDASRAVRVDDVADPACPDDGVVVAVKARPINPADLLLLNGRHVFSPTLPAAVGIEGAGVVVAAGPRSRLTAGTVVAIPQGGTWREQMALRDDQVLALPADVEVEQAAMLCVNPFTVMGMLEGVAAGATVIVNAGTSAVSKLVIAVARQRGIAVVAVVRDARATDELKALGAVAVLVDGDDLAARVAPVAPSPVVRALDAVAGSASGRLYDCVADGGDLVVYGLLASDRVELPAARLVFRDVTVRGFSRLRIFAAMPPARRREITDELVALLADGTLRVDVEARYPLADVAAALAHQTRPGRRGKVLLVS
ncbi:MAG: zinc-dependent alcohol dehydrogenase family protein [Deltaproteobacteria bacterium]|nr:zinc-dependent alcohol dehydrogenase family protein [Deltaproteobacteria bacterium]